MVRKLTIQLDIVDDSIVSDISYYDWYVWFNIGGVQARVNPAIVNPSVTKNQIFHLDGAIADNIVFTAVGYGQPWKNSWRLELSVPPAFQRINENDVIELVIQGGPNAAHSSIKSTIIYKEIFP